MANYAKSLSKEFGPKGICVNTIGPGPVATDLWLADDGVAAQFASASGSSADQVVDAVAAGAATDDSPPRRRWQTSPCSWPVMVPPTSPAPTSASTGLRHHDLRHDDLRHAWIPPVRIAASSR